MNQITTQMLPTLNDLGEDLLAIAKDTELMSGAIGAAAGAFKVLVSAAIILGTGLRAVVEGIGSAAAINQVTEGEFSAAINILNEEE